MNKTCAKCKVEKSVDEFNKSKDRKDGLNPYCRECCKRYRDENRDKILAQKKRHYDENLDMHRERNRKKYERNKDVYRESQVQYYSDPDNWVKRMLMKSRERAAIAGLEHNITVEDIPPIPEHCPYLGVKLTFQLGRGQLPSNASLDRINSDKGYVKGNIQIISRKANTMKNDASQQELLEFATNILRMSQSE